MKAMLASDFAQVKRFVLQTAAICACVIVIMIVSCDSLMMGVSMGAAAIAVMLPCLMTYSVLSYDEMAGWARLRETLPLSKRDIVFGRYAGVLVASLASLAFSVAVALAAYAVIPATGLGGSAFDAQAMGGVSLPAMAGLAGVGGMSIALVMLSVILPIAMRFGVTRSVRILPLIFVFGFCAFAGFMQSKFTLDLLMGMTPVVAGLSLAVGALALFIVSALVALRLYGAREF